MEVYKQAPLLVDLDAKIIRRRVTETVTYALTDRTIFAPHEEYGQLPDIGTIDGIPVVTTVREKGTILHVLEKNPTKSNVVMKLDFQRRLDNMKQQTARYILSQVLERLYDVKTLSHEIAETESWLSIPFEDDEQGATSLLRLAEREANRVVGYGLRVFLDGDFVCIDSFSPQPYRGVFLDNTGDVNAIYLPKYEKKDRQLKIFYVAGSRSYLYHRQLSENTQRKGFSMFLQKSGEPKNQKT
jgi:Ser-tRNA(Ala) deacylase AlaX